MFNIIKQQNQKGFTLIELLVVIAIIGILAGILFVAINPKEQTDKAMDAKRLSEFNQIQKALEIYNLEHGQYPPLNMVNTNNGGKNLDEFENYLKPYMPNLDFSTDVWGPYPNTYFGYRTSVHDNHNSYGMLVQLVSPSNFNITDNDNGVHPGRRPNHFYEVGPLVWYCKNKYSGDDGIWWNVLDGSVLCPGGN